MRGYAKFDFHEHQIRENDDPWLFYSGDGDYHGYEGIQHYPFCAIGAKAHLHGVVGKWNQATNTWQFAWRLEALELQVPIQPQLVRQHGIVHARDGGEEKQHEITTATACLEIVAANEEFHECAICMLDDSKPNVIFLPCRHAICCSTCARMGSVRNCPFCRQQIESRVKFMPNPPKAN
jgi:hypothetical protein